MERGAAGATSPPRDAGAATLRRLLLALVLLGSAGLLLELALLEHTESLTQWIPFVVLGAGLLSSGAVAFRPSRGAIRLQQTVMIALVGTGIIGLWLHYRGNAVFELEIEPDAAGLALVWAALRGATPALAPGAFIQLGLLGLLQAYRHPALERA